MSNLGEFENFIDSAFVAGAGRRFEDIDPTTGEVIGLVHEADRAQVDLVVTAAQRALKGPWGEMSEADRSTLLVRLYADTRNICAKP